MSKLSLRIIALTSVVFVIGIFFIATMITRNELARESRSILTQGMTFAELTAPSLYQDYLTTSTEGSQNFQDILTERLARDPDIRTIMMVSNKGKIIFDSDDIGRGIPIGRTGTSADRHIADVVTLEMLTQDKTSQRNYTLDGEEFTEIVVPLLETTGGHTLSMRYTLSYEAVTLRRQATAAYVLGLASPLLIIAAILSISLALSITRPLKRMADIAYRIGRGDFSGIAPIGSPGELGALAVELNGMSQELKISREKDASHRGELNIKVEQLEAAKAKLEQSLDELSRFQRVTIDRELRINELKQQNRTLAESAPAVGTVQPERSTNNSQHDNT